MLIILPKTNDQEVNFSETLKEFLKNNQEELLFYGEHLFDYEKLLSAFSIHSANNRIVLNLNSKSSLSFINMRDSIVRIKEKDFNNQAVELNYSKLKDSISKIVIELYIEEWRTFLDIKSSIDNVEYVVHYKKDFIEELQSYNIEDLELFKEYLNKVLEYKEEEFPEDFELLTPYLLQVVPEIILLPDMILYDNFQGINNKECGTCYNFNTLHGADCTNCFSYSIDNTFSEEAKALYLNEIKELKDLLSL